MPSRSPKDPEALLGQAGVAEEAKSEFVLSERWGGRSNARTYCIYYYARPRNLFRFILCYGYLDEVSGNRVTPTCCDFALCTKNPPGSGVKKKPYDSFVLKELETVIPGDPSRPGGCASVESVEEQAVEELPDCPDEDTG